MFCSKCGYKISKGSKVCSNCQTPVSETEVCGGFWGLVGNNRQNPPAAMQAGSSGPAPGRDDFQSSVSSPDFPVPESRGNNNRNESSYYFDSERYEKERQEDQASKSSGKGGIFPILTGLFFAAFLITIGVSMFRSSNYKKELARKDVKIEKLESENAELKDERDGLKADIEDKDGQIEDLQKSMAGKIDDNVDKFQKNLHKRIRDDYNKVTGGDDAKDDATSPSLTTEENGSGSSESGQGDSSAADDTNQEDTTPASGSDRQSGVQ